MVGVVVAGPVLLKPKPKKILFDIETPGVWAFGDGWARRIPDPYGDCGSLEMPGPIRSLLVKE